MSDYIDRETLPQKKERGFFLDDDFNAGWNACLNKIFTIPAADVRPVVRGKWIPVTNGRGGNECSLCHEYAPSFQNGEEHLTSFCPNCGAGMEVRT